MKFYSQGTVETSNLRKMKLLVFLLPLALAAPSDLVRRLNLGFLENVINKEELTFLVHTLAGNLGTNETEAACETECDIIVKHHALYSLACPLVCHSLQELVHQIDPISKRSIFSDALTNLKQIFDMEHLKEVVHQMVALIGSDPTEARCESGCHAVIMADHLLQHGCPLVCKSFQSLVQHFDAGHTDPPVV